MKEDYCIINEDFPFWKDKLEQILNQGKTMEVIEKAKELVEKKIFSVEEEDEFCAFIAWGLYRQKNFEQAEQAAFETLKTNNERGIRCLAAIKSYQGNLEEAKKYLNMLPDNPSKANSRMIGFRSKQDNTPKEEVLAVAFKWVGEIVDKINTANLMNNTARWLLEKGENVGDLMLAHGFMNSAIGLYGTGDVNLHHRASANYWVSIIMEKLFGFQAAILAAEQSLTLWDMQLSKDPENENYIKSRNGAINRLNELIRKINSNNLNHNVVRTESPYYTQEQPISVRTSMPSPVTTAEWSLEIPVFTGDMLDITWHRNF